MAKINLWSRVGNKLYIVLHERKNTNNFDILYDDVYNIDWKKYLNRYYPVIVKATSIKSALSSTPAIQKITKKAIVDKMTNKS
jgi:putative N6-adenine-specific DNA methylase